MQRAFVVRLCVVLLTTMVTTVPGGARAGEIEAAVFYEFGFGAAGTLATGCDPADPAGNFCVPSSGTPTSFLDAPPWTFTAPVVGARLIVVDAFESGDVFSVLDGGVFLGFTSNPGDPVDCGDDPVSCLENPAVSQRVFLLGEGGHSITIESYLAPSLSGSGYLAWAPIPEPGVSTLLATGLAALACSRRRVGAAR